VPESIATRHFRIHTEVKGLRPHIVFAVAVDVGLIEGRKHDPRGAVCRHGDPRLMVLERGELGTTPGQRAAPNPPMRTYYLFVPGRLQDLPLRLWPRLRDYGRLTDARLADFLSAMAAGARAVERRAAALRKDEEPYAER
jgi:hypothetical protein